MKTTSRAAAPRRLPPEERERSILDGAVALASESGLEALTVRAVAAHVGVTPALVAHYRPVMESFVAEVFTAIVAAERDEVIAAYDPAVDLRANLLRLIETLLDDSRDDVAMVWVQSWALGARNEALGARVRAEMDHWHSALEDLITRAIAEDSALPVDPASRIDAASSAWMLLAMVDGMSAHSLVHWAPRDRADLARRTLTAVLDVPVAPATVTPSQLAETHR
ncbi:AcrR family transcriptional regulator [Microbacterium phyllosphaerae]|uniref:AcrR family transcriptional regulator n=1 Tax=Microbacterium phyllosphaerae TaxID=124798 RepID=A0ABS4WUT3_9MICO|nr:TetR/AcrR family transcriptional regulator [Microbacterium phyllosphaerae]MBP2379826.1 AcrR family transcriptional regulator [Microbacterium phyllosphaerae]